MISVGRQNKEKGWGRMLWIQTVGSLECDGSKKLN